MSTKHLPAPPPFSPPPIPDDYNAGYFPSVPRDTRIRLKRHRTRTHTHEKTQAPEILLGALPAGAEGATIVSFSPDGTLIALACVADESSAREAPLYAIRIYCADTGREACGALIAHSALIHSLDWNPESSALLSAGADGVAVVWRIPRSTPGSRAPLNSPPSLHAVLTPPLASYLYAATFHPGAPSAVITASYDGSLRLWDVALDDTSGGQMGLEAHLIGEISEAVPRHLAGTTRALRAYVNTLAWDTKAHTDGSTRRLLAGDSQGAIKVYQVASVTSNTTTASMPSQFDTSRYPLIDTLILPAFEGIPIVSICVRASVAALGATHALVLGQANILRIVDIDTHTQLRVLSGVHCSAVRAQAFFSPCGNLAAAGGDDGILRVWNTESGAPVSVTIGGLPAGFPSLLVSLSWSPTSHSIAIAGFGAGYNALLLGSLHV